MNRSRILLIDILTNQIPVNQPVTETYLNFWHENKSGTHFVLERSSNSAEQNHELVHNTIGILRYEIALCPIVITEEAYRFLQSHNIDIPYQD